MQESWSLSHYFLNCLCNINWDGKRSIIFTIAGQLLQVQTCNLKLWAPSLHRRRCCSTAHINRSMTTRVVHPISCLKFNPGIAIFPLSVGTIFGGNKLRGGIKLLFSAVGKYSGQSLGMLSKSKNSLVSYLCHPPAYTAARGHSFLWCSV
jgi:hypothetical protein